MGLAFENIFKGVLLYRNPHLVDDGKFGDEFPAIHDLHQLSEEIDVTLRPEEVFLLQRLSPYIYWFAKYPVPLKAVYFEAMELDRADFDTGLRLCARLLNQASQEVLKISEQKPLVAEGTPGGSFERSTI